MHKFFVLSVALFHFVLVMEITEIKKVKSVYFKNQVGNWQIWSIVSVWHCMERKLHVHKKCITCGNSYRWTE